MLKNEILTSKGTPLWAMDYNDDEDYDGDWLTPAEKMEIKLLEKQIEEIDIEEIEVGEVEEVEDE